MKLRLRSGRQRVCHTHAQAVSFAFAYFAGYFALYEMARLQPYQTVLITTVKIRSNRRLLTLTVRRMFNHSLRLLAQPALE
jgi:hypothetical protein